VALRYFNAAGADLKLRAGECHEPETHLIPRVLKSARAGRSIEVFGSDYPTPDGTCVRDYIHVWDLAQAHEAAMRRLLSSPTDAGIFEVFNLGSESGYSVKEIIAACEKVIGRKIPVTMKDRRPGDPPRLVAQAALAKKELSFQAKLGLDAIVQSAWDWEKKNSSQLGKAVFLDRDGTINDDPGYLSDPSQIKLLPRVSEALASLKKAGFKLIVVSNQSGVARGIVKEADLPKIHQELNRKLGEASAIDYFELCTHHPDSSCECRKPKPKLIQDAARKHGIDLLRSFMIGDKVSDIGAGRSAELKASILVRTGCGLESEALLRAGEASFIADSLTEAAAWILKNANP
jgi:histidinol-phosphate phosphatase family protein